MKKLFITAVALFGFYQSGTSDSPKTKIVRDKKTTVKMVKVKIDHKWVILDSGQNISFGPNRENLFVDGRAYDNASSPQGNYWHLIKAENRDF